ncbi:MAG: 50S ribosomal protein L21 [Proteobacteria bacterium]|nr:50S ribosomal protein L21 [Pseudomonadota bacterium]
MYAVFQTGGKQYKASQGDLVRVERLNGKVGDKVLIKEVLVVAGDKGIQVGTPLLAKAQVVGKIVEHGRNRKITIFKHKRRKGYRRKTGHRQAFTCIRIDRIKL